MYKACKLKPFPANVAILQPLKNIFFGVLRAQKVKTLTKNVPRYPEFLQATP